MTRWEYLTVAESQFWDKDKDEFEIKYWISRPEHTEWRELEKFSLNELGEEGWELVSQLTRRNGILLEINGLHTGGVAVDLRHVFKRPKQ